MKHIVLTGGGTAGHVTPNIALIPKLQEKGFQISYIGSYNGIEKSLIQELGIPYYGISSGKLRRYFDIKNFSDPFRVLKGYSQAKKLMKQLKPDVVFSKGGFVTVPVVLAAKKRKIPAIIHESDMTRGWQINCVFLQQPKSAVIFRKLFPHFQQIKQSLQELLSVRNSFTVIKKLPVTSAVFPLTNRFF